MNLGFVNNPAVRHVANNLTIFGFGSQEGALVQCIKELVENSIDACKRSNATFNDRQMEIKISISNSENGADSLVAVEVQDEGCGMTDVQNLLKPFNTSKDTATTQGLGHTTGRFGVGLSTCMIYSLLNTVDCPMRILTKCPESAAVTAYNFTMDTQGNPRCIQCQELGARGIMSVSLVRLRMPLRTDRAEPLRRVVSTVHGYLQALDLLPTSFFRTELRVQVGALSYANSYPGFDPVMARQALQSEDRLRTQYLLKCAHKAQGLGVGEVGWVADCAAVLLAEAGSTYELTVLATLRRRRELEVEKEVEEREREREYVGAGDRVRAVPVTYALPLTLRRYANHVPLLDLADDALVCAVTAALRSINFSNLGFKLQLRPDGGAPAVAAAPPAAAAAPPAAAAAPVPLGVSVPRVVWELVPLRAAVEAAAAKQKLELELMVNVVGGRVPFASMKKTAIATDDPNLVKMIARGVVQALDKLLLRTKAPPSAAAAGADADAGPGAMAMAVAEAGADAGPGAGPGAGAEAGAAAGDGAVAMAVEGAGEEADAWEFADEYALLKVFAPRREYKERLLLGLYLPSIAVSMKKLSLMALQAPEMPEEKRERVSDLVRTHIQPQAAVPLGQRLRDMYFAGPPEPISP